MWKRYRFKTKSVDDYRPLVYNAKYPWWCSGEGDDYAIIITYLLEDEDLLKYWDDAFDITFDKYEEITFSDRFPKPVDFLELDEPDYIKVSPLIAPVMEELTELERIESDIVKELNNADEKLSSKEFSQLAESIISYIDDLGRNK